MTYSTQSDTPKLDLEILKGQIDQQSRPDSVKVKK